MPLARPPLQFSDLTHSSLRHQGESLSVGLGQRRMLTLAKWAHHLPAAPYVQLHSLRDASRRQSAFVLAGKLAMMAYSTDLALGKPSAVPPQGADAWKAWEMLWVTLAPFALEIALAEISAAITRHHCWIACTVALVAPTRLQQWQGARPKRRQWRQQRQQPQNLRVPAHELTAVSHCQNVFALVELREILACLAALALASC